MAQLGRSYSGRFTGSVSLRESCLAVRARAFRFEGVRQWLAVDPALHLYYLCCVIFGVCYVSCHRGKKCSGDLEAGIFSILYAGPSDLEGTTVVVFYG